MTVVEIRTEPELQALETAWRKLLSISASDTIFLTWEWLTAWWSSYGTRGELRILAAYDETGVLRGIAPLRQEFARKYGQTVLTLTFAGDGSNDSDYLDFIIASGYEEQVMEAFRGHLSKEMSRGTVLQFHEIPEVSPNLPFLKKLCPTSESILTETDVACGSVRLPEDWPDYLSSLRPRFRTKLRGIVREMENRPDVRFGFCESPEAVAHMLPILFHLHTRRWATDAKPGVFGWDRKRDFYSQLSALLLERGWLRFGWLEWNGRILACQYGFAYKDTYFQLQEGYEPASEHWNVGIALRAWTIREFIKQGLRNYDFLGGIGRHKSDWGAQTKRSKKIQIAKASYKNRIFCLGPAWESRARESIKSLVPQKIVESRRKRLEARSLALFREDNNGHSPEPLGREWMRKAMAHCYFSLGLPHLTRPLRDKYQLLLSANGKGPGVSWKKRTEPCARILYYHRVNDERDPFFPAKSTTMFEREMRYVAQHYKVVSLAELMVRLKEGPTEPVLAVTFDDGYQDNYHCALPVLERLGLPATIFLTTGSIDSGDPLWFEQLAQALKTTELASLDLEIDFPRRFWMRTELERLQSNTGIFALLRDLSDSERRKQLTEILRQLRAPKNQERRNKLLTWDQIRLMKAHGIDFGGHTVTHPFLSKMPKDDVAWEVTECKRRIEEQLQLPVPYFAYPSGREEDFGPWNKEVIRAAGYQAAFTTIWGMNYRSTDPMELRRGGPWEEEPAMFSYKLDWYQFTND